MPRLTSLDAVMFPVDEWPLYVSVFERGRERRVRVPRKRALVDRDSGRVVGVVGPAYRLVTNREALALAYECCRSVFPDTEPSEWQPARVDAPSTAGHCRIDLAHNTTALDFSFVPPGERPEAFGPFIRVTNSYNGLRALGFDIGFYRKVCRNGLIAPESIVRFRFNHQRGALREAVQFRVARERLAQFTALFTDSLARLHACPVPAAHFLPLLRGVLMVRPPRRPDPGSVEAGDWAALAAHLREVCRRYARELGENAYALFNAITEFASHPPPNRCLHRDSHRLQQLAGAWLGAFNAASRRPGFSILGQVREFAIARAKADRARSQGSPVQGRLVPIAGAAG